MSPVNHTPLLWYSEKDLMRGSAVSAKQRVFVFGCLVQIVTNQFGQWSQGTGEWSKRTLFGSNRSMRIKLENAWKDTRKVLSTAR